MGLGTVFIIIAACLAFIFYLVALILGFVITSYPKSKVTANEISTSNEPPVNFIFVYTKGQISQETYTYKDGKRKCKTTIAIQKEEFPYQ